jgi:hypothetical protein
MVLCDGNENGEWVGRKGGWVGGQAKTEINPPGLAFGRFTIPHSSHMFQYNTYLVQPVPQVVHHALASVLHQVVQEGQRLLVCLCVIQGGDGGGGMGG